MCPDLLEGIKGPYRFSPILVIYGAIAALPQTETPSFVRLRRAVCITLGCLARSLGRNFRRYCCRNALPYPFPPLLRKACIKKVLLVTVTLSSACDSRRAYRPLGSGSQVVEHLLIAECAAAGFALEAFWCLGPRHA